MNNIDRFIKTKIKIIKWPIILNNRISSIFSIAFLFTLLSSQAVNAEYYDNARADEIYQKFELVNYNEKEIDALLAEYKSIIVLFFSGLVRK